MAQLFVVLQIVREGLDGFNTSTESILQAARNAHLDDLALTMADGPLTFEGMAIAKIGTRYEPGRAIVYIKPTPAMILYIGWLMTRLPSRATVTWRDGWPHVHCPPRDDREGEDGPAPQVPGQCLPA